jgi:hypothetical protein
MKIRLSRDQPLFGIAQELEPSRAAFFRVNPDPDIPYREIPDSSKSPSKNQPVFSKTKS